MDLSVACCLRRWCERNEVLKLLLVRDDLQSAYTFGKIFVDGDYECETLEDTDRQIEINGVKIAGQTAIPRGIYNVIINRSDRFSRLASKKAGKPVDVFLPLLLNVKQFTGIRIHPLNFATQSEGCIGVGQYRDAKRGYIGNSRLAFDALFNKIKAALLKGETVTIEVK